MVLAAMWGIGDIDKDEDRRSRFTVLQGALENPYGRYVNGT